MNKDIVLIEWVDSKGMERWEYLDEIEPMPPSVCYSVGFLIKDNKDYKTIAFGLSETQVLGRTTIPAGCIKSIRKLPIASFGSALRGDSGQAGLPSTRLPRLRSARLELAVKERVRTSATSSPQPPP